MANLEIWQTEPVGHRIAALAKLQAEALDAISGDRRFCNIRQLGTIAAFNISGASDGYLADIALPLRAACLKRGVLIRPLGATVYVMPPYCTTAVELETVYAAISDAIDEVTA